MCYEISYYSNLPHLSHADAKISQVRTVESVKLDILFSLQKIETSNVPNTMELFLT